MRRKMPLLLGTFAALALAAFMYNGDAATTSEPSIVPTTAAATTGYTVHIDPVTRQFVDTPISPDFSKQLDGASLSDDEFVIEDAPVGGGKMVNLQGRFQHTFEVKADANGALQIECDDDNTTNGK